MFCFLPALCQPRNRTRQGRFNRADIPRIVAGLHLTIATALGWAASAHTQSEAGLNNSPAGKSRCSAGDGSPAARADKYQLRRAGLSGGGPHHFVDDPDPAHTLALLAWRRVNFAAGSCRLLDLWKTSAVAGSAFLFGPAILQFFHIKYPKGACIGCLSISGSPMTSPTAPVSAAAEQ
jgi:hypothetical protein